MRRVGRPVLALIFLLAAVGVVLSAGPRTAGAGGVTADRTQITQLEQRIAAQGAAVQQLVVQADAAQGHLAALQAQLAADTRQLAADRAADSRAVAQLRQVALMTYMTGAEGTSAASTLGLFTTGSATATMARSEYSGLAANDLSTAIDAYRRDQQLVGQATSAVRRTTAGEAQTVAALTADRQQARAALAADQATLGQVKGNLGVLLAAAAARQAAARQAQERRALAAEIAAAQAAAQAAASAPVSAPVSSAPVVNPQPGVYADPLRSIAGLSPERVDQGVDFSGFGPIYAIGDGVVMSTVNGGWPGGTFITYRLTDGPAAGLVVYAAEDIVPQVSVGQLVTPGTVLGTVYEGPDGIETGWASASALGETMAMSAGQYSGANTTAYGYDFSQLLQALGAPGGVLQNDPPTGALAPGWPQW